MLRYIKGRNPVEQRKPSRRKSEKRPEPPKAEPARGRSSKKHKETPVERLYIGTTERIAKTAPVFGVGVGPEPVYLTDVYPGYFAFYASTREDDRYGIIEVDTTLLDEDRFLPCEWYLEQASQKRSRSESERNKRLDVYRKTLEKHRNKWQKSLRGLGVCAYLGPIPKKAVRRVTIFDPQSNQLITEAIVTIRLSLAGHRSGLERNKALTRWLMGEDVSLVEWLAGQPGAAIEASKEELAERLQQKWGLDLFFYGPRKPD